MRRGFGRLFLFTVVGVVCARPASAQQVPSFVVSGGYEQLRGVSPMNGEGPWGGWYGDFAGYVRKSVALVGQVSEHRQSFDESLDLDGFLLTVHAESKLQMFLGGMRAAARNQRHFVPFIQVLGGVARASGTGSVQSDLPPPGGDETFKSSDSRGAVEIGGGLDVMATRRIGFRLAANYFRLFVSGASKVWVLRAGGVVALGK